VFGLIDREENNSGLIVHGKARKHASLVGQVKKMTSNGSSALTVRKSGTVNVRLVLVQYLGDFSLLSF
jgi:hypothetical protein